MEKLLTINKISHGVPTTEYVVQFKKEDGKIKRFSYSEHRLGKYAKLLAEYVIAHEDEIMKTMKRPEVYIEEKEDYAIMKLYSKSFGYFDVFIDKEDVEKVRCHTWMLSKRLTGKGYYVRNNKLGRLHRYLMNINDENIMIDHIDRNTLNNRKSNLRIADAELNMRNINIQTNNTSGITGVRCDGKKWWAQIVIDGKQKTKSFTISKYGDEEAKKMAIAWRKQKEIENNYLGE
jgi:hypothetical protein